MPSFDELRVQQQQKKLEELQKNGDAGEVTPTLDDVRNRNALKAEKAREKDGYLETLPELEPDNEPELDEDDGYEEGGSSSGTAESANVEYRESTKKDPQIAGSGSSKKKKKKDSDPDNPYAQLRNFPKSLLAYCVSMFPDAPSGPAAVAAFVYVNMPNTAGVEVPDIVRELASKYQGDKSVQNINKSMATMAKAMKAMSEKQDAIELGVSHIILDRLGLRDNLCDSLSKIDLDEKGLDTIKDNLETLSKKKRDRDNIKNGRPIR